MQNAPEGTTPAGVIKYLWTDEAIKIVCRLRDEGKTATQIANSLSIEINRPVTKNMVIGKCSRYGIALYNARRPPWHLAEPTPNPFPERGCCLWPIGHPGAPGFHFCGEPTSPGRVYCEAHRAAAYDRRAPDSEGGANA